MPSAQPMVSILTPTYNYGRFIGETIDSVIAQTYSNWEMVIVDDGSTDDTPEILQAYVERDGRVRTFRQENKSMWGLHETYNFALEQARGELIAILDSDDLWQADKLDRQVPFHIGGGYSLTFGKITYVDERGREDPGNTYPEPDRHPFLRSENSDELLMRLLRGEFMIPAATVVISRDALGQVGGFQQPAYLPLADYPTWIVIAASVGRLAFMNEMLGAYRQHPTQSTWLLAREQARGEYRFAQDFVQHQRRDLLPAGTDPAQFLMSDSRRKFLAQSSYRAAAVAFERGATRKAAGFCAEVAGLRSYGLFGSCVAMLAAKSARRLTGRAPKR